jgi:TM2 domain-containing membrane protein YozV
MTPQHQDLPRFDPAAGFLALILPGLGHLYRGHRRRAAYIALGILGLFASGLLIGGIDSVDSREDRIWFLGQALVGPIAFGVDHLHQTRFKVIDPITNHPRSADPGEARDPRTARPYTSPRGEGPPNIKSLGKVNELGTLFSTIAGMLNLIVILDAAFPTRPRPPRRP